MQTQTPRLRQLFAPAVFALICTMLILETWHAFGGALPLGPQGYRVSTVLPEALNVNPGADVRIAGVSVGRVAEVERQRNDARIVLELEPDYAPLRSDARAVLRLKSLLGETFIEIAPGPAGAPAIPDGGSLPARQVLENQRLDAVLETFRPETRRRFRHLFAGMAKAFHGRAPSFNRALGEAAPTTEGFDSVLQALDEQRADVRSIVANSGTVMGALGDRAGALQAAVRAGDDVFAATAGRDRELAATIHELSPFLRQLERTSRTAGAAAPELQRAVEPLRVVAARLPAALRETRTTVPVIEDVFRGLPRVIAAGNRGLPALTRTFQATGPALRELYPTLRELNTFLKLLGVSKQAVVGIFADISNSNNATSIGPGGKLIHSAGGVVTVWNEAIGGWVKRLPTNRLNPYFKPGGTAPPDGILRTYDCRHLRNTPYLPSTGNGAPPCIEQGPWEFDGKTAYFPRLELAAP